MNTPLEQRLINLEHENELLKKTINAKDALIEVQKEQLNAFNEAINKCFFEDKWGNKVLGSTKRIEELVSND